MGWERPAGLPPCSGAGLGAEGERLQTLILNADLPCYDCHGDRWWLQHLVMDKKVLIPKKPPWSHMALSDSTLSSSGPSAEGLHCLCASLHALLRCSLGKAVVPISLSAFDPLTGACGNQKLRVRTRSRLPVLLQLRHAIPPSHHSPDQDWWYTGRQQADSYCKRTCHLPS